MKISRRSLITSCAKFTALASLFSLGISKGLATEQSLGNNVLVTLYLEGGNDGLNCSGLRNSGQ